MVEREGGWRGSEDSGGKRRSQLQAMPWVSQVIISARRRASGSEGSGRPREKALWVASKHICPQITLPQFQGSSLAGEQQNQSQPFRHGMKGTEKTGGHKDSMPSGTRAISSVTWLERHLRAGRADDFLEDACAH